MTGAMSARVRVPTPPYVAGELLAWQGQLRSTALNGRSAGGPVGKDAQERDGSSQPPRQAAGPAGRAVWLARLATKLHTKGD